MTIALAVVAALGWGLLVLSIRSSLSWAKRADEAHAQFSHADTLRASYLTRIRDLERQLDIWRRDREAA